MANYCWNCGKELSPGANFCRYCGARQNIVDYHEPQRMVYEPYKVKKPVYFWQIASVFAFVLLIAILASIGEASAEDEKQRKSERTTDLLVDAQEVEIETEETYAEKETKAETKREFAIGEDKSNPFVLSADELVSEINADVKAAKQKYNGKWVKITGKITDTSDGGVSYGYYLYGESILTGYRGLRIVCWCDDGPYSGSVIGDTQTFVGQILEITTVNATEIVACERVKESE